MWKVLIVEDDPHIGRLVEVKLRNNGFAVVRAEDGVQGLSATRLERPDLVILDVMMPGMDGFEVLRQIRGDPVVAGIPVIMLTSLGQEEQIQQGIAMGAADYVTKPFSPSDLLMRVRRALRRVGA